MFSFVFELVRCLCSVCVGVLSCSLVFVFV